MIRAIPCLFFQQWVPFCLTPESVCLVSTLLNSLLISYKIYKDFSDWCRRWHSTSHFTNCFPRQSGDIFKVTPTTSSGSGDRLWTRSCLLMCSYILLLILYKGLDYMAYSVLVRLWFLCFNTKKWKEIFLIYHGTCYLLQINEEKPIKPQRGEKSSFVQHIRSQESLSENEALSTVVDLLVGATETVRK